MKPSPTFLSCTIAIKALSASLEPNPMVSKTHRQQHYEVQMCLVSEAQIISVINPSHTVIT